MVGYGDVEEGDLLGVLEERVGPPHLAQPRRRQQPVLGRQIVRKAQPVIGPRLREEDVGRVRLRPTTPSKKANEKKRQSSTRSAQTSSVDERRRTVTVEKDHRLG